jgi:hypothetical protein
MQIIFLLQKIRNYTIGVFRDFNFFKETPFEKYQREKKFTNVGVPTVSDVLNMYRGRFQKGGFPMSPEKNN